MTKSFRPGHFSTKTPSSYPTGEMRELFGAILKLRNQKEAEQFFRDLLTVAELKEFAQRWQIVKLLAAGTPYAVVAKKLKVSTTTVSRVAYWLFHGTGGYKLIASR